MKTIYEQVIVMGIGSVAAQCAKLMSTMVDNLCFLESRQNTMITQESFCKKNNIEYLNLGGGW